MFLSKKNPNSGDGVTLDGTDKTGYTVRIQWAYSGAKWTAFYLRSWHRAIALYNILANDIDRFEGEFLTMTGRGENVTTC